MTALPLLLVAAVARNGVIGADNRLLWRLSSDLRRFKALTMGKPLVMGARPSSRSAGRCLAARPSSSPATSDFSAPRAFVAHDLEAAWRSPGIGPRRWARTRS